MFDADPLKTQFVPKYKEIGEYGFYRFLLMYALDKLVMVEKGTFTGTLPNLEYLTYHDRFIILYRREGDPIYLEMAKLFRKVAHKVYRIMLKKNMVSSDKKFLNLV